LFNSQILWVALFTKVHSQDLHVGNQTMKGSAAERCEVEKSAATDAALPPRITQTVQVSPTAYVSALNHLGFNL